MFVLSFDVIHGLTQTKVPPVKFRIKKDQSKALYRRLAMLISLSYIQHLAVDVIITSSFQSAVT